MPNRFTALICRQRSFASAVLLGAMLFHIRLVAAEFKVGLVLDRGGKDDKSFNSSAYQGATHPQTRGTVFTV